jgi:putative transposase
MSNRYKGIYRGQTFRLKNWDYGSAGIYFVTICTQNKEHYFGTIENGEMRLSAIGQIVKSNWMEILEQFSIVQLDEFVVMPNHIHGILIVEKSMNLTNSIHANKLESIDNSGGITGNKNPMFYNNISRIIRWYKGKCTFEIRKIDPLFKWQALFHDHIVRNEYSLKTIRKYIQENPSKWETDEFI